MPGDQILREVLRRCPSPVAHRLSVPHCVRAVRDQDTERVLERNAVDRGLKCLLLRGEPGLAVPGRSLAFAERHGFFLHLPFEGIVAFLERLLSVTAEDSVWVTHHGSLRVIGIGRTCPGATFETHFVGGR